MGINIATNKCNFKSPAYLRLSMKDYRPNHSSAMLSWVIYAVVYSTTYAAATEMKSVLDLFPEFVKLQDKLAGNVAKIQKLEGNVAQLQTVTQNKTPYVSFKASRSHHITLSGGQTIVFNTVKENTHGAYNHRNGVFTAPMQGKFLFSVHVLSQKDQYVPVAIALNGRKIMRFHTGQSKLWSSTAYTMVLLLQKGDLVNVVMAAGQTGHVWGGEWTLFSGVLL